jgi:hypothetical protein
VLGELDGAGPVVDVWKPAAAVVVFNELVETEATALVVGGEELPEPPANLT